MKKTLCLIISAILFVLLLTACGNEKQNKKAQAPEGTHKLLFRDNSKSESVTANFINSKSGTEAKVEMKLEKEDDGSKTFSCMGDPKSFNKVYFTYQSGNTAEVAYNELVQGWYNSTYGFLPYIEGDEEEYNNVKYDTKTFDYRTYKKDVFIWKPADYDASSDEKYSVIYLEDGDKMLDRTTPDSEGSGSWNVAESVAGMMTQSGNKAIVVAISTPEITRSSELLPDLGEVHESMFSLEEKGGKYFSDFVCNTVVPYIEKNYNVFTDPAHNAVCGSSLGGLESFYIGMEHPEKFGTIGAMSPSLGFFDFANWERFLTGKSFDENSPFVYIYAGGDTTDNGSSSKAMAEYLPKIGYPNDKVFLDILENGEHSVPFWRNIFSEFLKAIFDPRGLIDLNDK